MINRNTSEDKENTSLEDLRTDSIPVERDDSEAERRQASAAAALRPVTGYAPLNAALGANSMGLLGEPLMGGAIAAGTPTLLGMESPFGHEDSDARLTDAAEVALAEEPRLATQAAAGIQVSVAYGVVELDGDVSSEADREIAEEVVSRLPGVQSLENRLHVRPTAA